MSESDKDKSDRNSKTMAEAKKMGICYGSQGLLFGTLLCNPIIGIVAGAVGYGLGMLVTFAKANSNGGE
jgi:uncharacterized membrane protein